MAAKSDAKATETDGAKKVVIKKYANRRLYNTARSSYVTLDDLSRMVRAGEDFAVYDAKSGDDITHAVLTQIIFEEEQKGQTMLPTNFLRQLIRLYGDALQGVVPSYLEASMQAFSENQERVREGFRVNPAMANFEAMTRHNMKFFEQTMRIFNPFGIAAGSGEPNDVPTDAEETGRPARPATDEKPDAEELAGRTRDLERLRRQLSDMQSELDKLNPKND